MYIKRLEECEEFIARDDSPLRELLHPDKADVAIRYSLAQARVEPGQKTKSHKLRSTEVYYILEGQGMMHIGQERQEVGPSCTVYIPPEAVQFIENTGRKDLKFLCIVEPAWREEDEEILE